MKASLLAIGGMSRSGKSTLAEQLVREFSNRNLKTCVVSQDDYCLPSSMLPKINGLPDWEQPESMDWDRYHEHVFQQRQTHQWVIVEGLFVCEDHKLKAQYQRSIMLDIDHDTFMARRDREQRWGKEPAWYIQYVWDVYQSRSRLHDEDLTLSGKESIHIPSLMEKLSL